MVNQIKEMLGLDAGLTLAAAIRQANSLVGLAEEGALPQQARKLLDVLGV